MDHHSVAYVGFDTSKTKHAVAVAEGGREGEVRYLGEIEAAPAAVERLLRKLAHRYKTLHVCYEAGPTGYGLYRHIRALGYTCDVIAPSLVPKRPGDRVKTNRRDAVTLARLAPSGRADRRSGCRTRSTRPFAIWCAHGTRRLRICATSASRYCPFCFVTGASSRAIGTGAGRTCVGSLGKHSTTRPSRSCLQDQVDAVADAQARLERLDRQLAELVPTWSMAPVVAACQAMRGVSFLVAVTFVAEIGDVRRFESPRQLMAFHCSLPTDAAQPRLTEQKGEQSIRGAFNRGL